jgi:hypothetical protein
MIDRETFEDQDIIARYLSAVPAADAGHRAALRARLQSVPAEREGGGRRLVRWASPHRRWLALSGVVATCIAVAALIFPVSPHAPTAANAYQLLQRAGLIPGAGQGPSTPYSGSAVVTYTPNRFDPEPPGIARDLGPQKIITTWTVVDSTHFRIDTRVVSPAIDRRVETVVVNGSHILIYDASTRKAVTGWIDPRAGFEWLGILRAMRPIVPGPMVIGDWHALDPNRPLHTAVVGEEQVLGEEAEIVEVRPAVRAAVTICRSHRHCKPAWREYGRARFWIGRMHPEVLRWELAGVPAGIAGADYRYRVTAIRFGKSVNRAALSFRPPVQPVYVQTEWQRMIIGSGGISSWPGQPGARWPHVRGLVYAPPPIDSSGFRYTLLSTTHSAGVPGSRTTGFSGIYTDGAPKPDFPPPGFGPYLPGIRGPYVYIREEMRYAGLPRALKLGTPGMAGTCRAWTGQYAATGDRWLATRRGQINVLIIAHGWPMQHLMQYASRLCP